MFDKLRTSALAFVAVLCLTAPACAGSPNLPVKGTYGDAAGAVADRGSDTE